MPHMAIRLRMQSQNRLLGFPLDMWHTHTFPTVEALVRFGIQSARDGWEVVFPEGIGLRKVEEASVGAKSLYKSAGGKSLTKRLPNRPKLHNVPPNTDWRGNYLVTKMPDGLEIAWTSCGMCGLSVVSCTCSAGVTAPNSVRYIYVKTDGMLNGTKWEDVDAARKAPKDDKTPTYAQPWRENRKTTSASKRTGGKSLYKDKPQPTRENVFANVDLGSRKTLERLTKRKQQEQAHEPTVAEMRAELVAAGYRNARLTSDRHVMSMYKEHIRPDVEDIEVETPQGEQVVITAKTKLSDFDSEAKQQADNLLGQLSKRLGKTVPPTQTNGKHLPTKAAVAKHLPTKSLHTKSLKNLPRKQA